MQKKAHNPAESFPSSHRTFQREISQFSPSISPLVKGRLDKKNRGRRFAPIFISPHFLSCWQSTSNPRFPFVSPRCQPSSSSHSPPVSSDYSYLQPALHRNFPIRERRKKEQDEEVEVEEKEWSRRR
jgi:hypothetical protein